MSAGDLPARARDPRRRAPSRAGRAGHRSSWGAGPARGSRLPRVALALLVGLGVALSGPAIAADAPLSVDVRRDGLDYTGPCGIDWWVTGVDVRESPTVSRPDASVPGSLPVGDWTGRLRCPSTEGTLTTWVSTRLPQGGRVVEAVVAPAFVLVELRRDGDEVPGRVDVYDASSRRVAQGPPKRALPVPPGPLRVIARVDKSALAAGRRAPAFAEERVTARVGQKTSLRLDASDAIVRIDLRHNGKAASGSGALVRPGTLDRVVELLSGEPAPAPPGTYDVVTQLDDSTDFAEKRTTGVRLRRGQTRSVRIDHVTGRISPRFLGGDPPAGTRVQLFLGAAPEPFASLAPDEPIVVSPGTYRVRATAPEPLDDGQPRAAEAEVRVRKRRTAKARLDLRAATLVVRTTVGGEPRALPVEVWAPRSEAPLAKKTASDEGIARFALSPGPVRVVVPLSLPQGDQVQRFDRTLAPRAEEELAVDFAFGRALVQVFERGVAVFARVHFYEEGATAPRQSVRAGQEVFLPAGAYTPVVERRGKKRAFAPIFVLDGQRTERQLELTAPASDTP